MAKAQENTGDDQSTGTNSIVDEALTEYTETLVHKATEAKAVLDDLTTKTAELDKLHVNRGTELDERERKVQSREEELNKKQGELASRESTLDNAEKELVVTDTGSSATANNLILREQQVSEREKAISQKEYEAGLKVQKADEDIKAAALALKAIEARETQLAKDKAELNDFAESVEKQAVQNDEDRRKLMRLEQTLVNKAKQQ